MRRGNILPRDMLDKGEEDGNLMINSHKDAQSGEIGNLAQVYSGSSFAQQIKRRASPINEVTTPTTVFFWEAGTWPTPFLDIDRLFNIDFGGRRQIWNELFWSEFL